MIFPEKLMLASIVKNFPTFYGSRKFITVEPRVRDWIPSEPDGSNPHSSGFFLPIGYFHLLNVGCVFRSGYPTDGSYWTLRLISPNSPTVLHSSPTHYPWFDHPNNFQIAHEARISIRVSPVFVLPCADSGLATELIQRPVRFTICLRSITPD